MFPSLAAFIFVSSILLGMTTNGTAQTTPRVTPRIIAPVDEAVRTTLGGNTHPLARPEFDQGIAPPDLPMNRMLLVLRRSPEQEAALQALLDQQHDKSSANYHRWLTPVQFGEQFGPADQDVQAVTSWLAAHGFRVERIGQGKTAIEFSGTAAQVRDAFQTEIHSYLAGGEPHWANASDPQIPTALSPAILGVASLHNFPARPLLHVAGVFSKTMSTGVVKAISGTGPQFTFNDSSCAPASCYALGPSDFATIYNVLPLWNGTGTAGRTINGSGQSIAIVGESNIHLSDVEQFRSMFGLPPNDPQVIVDGPDPGVTQDELETEALLDVEWAGAVAPGANIKFITSASTNTADGAELSALYAVDNNVAPVLSVSFGLCELFLGTTRNQFRSALWEQAAAEGITAVVASGDSGSAGCDRFEGPTPEPAQNGLAVSGFASTPFNVAVGGTDFLNFGANFDVNSPSPYWNAGNSANGVSAKGYIPESTWNSTCTNDGFASPQFGITAEARCNNPQLNGLVETLGGSGGKSNCTAPTGFLPSDCSGGYSKPPWQIMGPRDNARDLPDVSLFASNGFLNTFYIVCQADVLPPIPPNASCNLQNGFANFLGVGGTSASTPAFAGIMALVNEYTNSTGQGNANYELYQLASLPSQTSLNCNSSAPTGPASGCIFNDVTFGTITVPCAAGSTSDCTVSAGGDPYGVLSGYDAGTGYDLATGLGSVNALNLVTNWQNATFNSTTTMLSLNGSTTAPVTISHGASVGVTVTVAKNGSVAGTPSGDVSLIANSANGQGVDNRTLNSSGTASWNTDRLPGGTNYSLHAHYAGDGTFGASDSPNIDVTVTPERSITNLTGLILSGGGNALLPSSISYGTTVFLRADVASATNPNDTAPTGNVTFTDNGSLSQTYSLNSEGTAIAGNGLCALAPGGHSFTASYSGDNSYTSSGPSSAASFTVMQATPDIVVLPPPPNVGSNSTLTLTVELGDGNTSLLPLTGPLCLPALPSGMITVFDGTTQVASSPVPNGSGGKFDSIAVIDIPGSVLPLGQSTITAVYSGDANYLGATSAPVAVDVTTPDFSLSDGLGSFGNVTIAAPGQSSAPITLIVTGTGGYDGTIVFSPASCVITPAGSLSSCSFSPSSITGSGSTQLVITTTAPHTANSPAGRFGLHGSKMQPILVLLLFAAILGIFRRQRRPSVAFGCVMLLALFGLWACSGGGSGGSSPSTTTLPGTPTGVMYTASINAAPAGSNAHSINVPFTVQ